MAIYHLSVKTISRSAGRSATAAAAYRAGVKIADERTGEVHDYTRKGGVESADLVLPENAPAWASERAALWNAAEQAETRKNSTVARELEIALPDELSADERRRLAVDLAREIVERHGCAADVAIHAPGQAGDHRNHHAHILVSTRRLTPEGFTEKTRELDDRKTGEVDRWRARFADLQNERLQEAGAQARVDHRTLDAQGIDRLPTQHLGPAVTGRVRRGASSEVAQRMAEEANARLFAARELGWIERELDRSIFDLTGDLSGAIQARNERQREALRAEREAERPPRGRQRPGPAVQSSRFTAQRQATPPRENRPPDVEAERQRIERMSAAELAAEIERRRPPPVHELVERDPDVIARERQWRELSEQSKQAKARERKSRDEAQRWREDHPLRAKAHDAGLARAAFLAEREQIEQSSHLDWLAVAPRVDDADLFVSYARQNAEARITREQAPARAKLDELARIQRQKQAQEREQRREMQARAELERKFKEMAIQRAMKAHGYRDTSDDWQATPQVLRELIDDYNRHTKTQQERALAAWVRDPELSQAIASLIEKRQENLRENDRGMSL